ncbi:MAG: hypothetical protein JW993_11715, partial [Sedimentisphaerales bacterium]|nr:hypothetical protein [Sedimentisphaerales bacterium]
WYSLTVRGAYDYFNLVQTNLAGYTSDGATSVGGTVKSSDWIQYRYEDIFVTPTAATGNKFWDQPEDTEPPQDKGTLDGYKRDADTGTGLENWRIYIDLNGNGQWDSGEPSDLTDGNGYYRIADVEPGTYRVCEVMQSGWEAGQPCVEGVTVLGGTTTTQDFHNRKTQAGGQIDVFAVCLDIELEVPGVGRTQTSLSGPVTVYTQIGPNGEASDTEGDGRDDVPTEIVSLSLSGSDPVLGQVTLSLSAGTTATGQIEETANNTPGVLDVAPFTLTGSADSFFDVWFQIDLPDLGVTLLSSQAKRLADVITHVPPGVNGYAEVAPATIGLLDQNGQATGALLGPIYACGSAPPMEDQYDFGDAPDTYRTLHSSNGPYHDAGEVFVGSAVDAEADGRPGAQADGDDNLGSDDEDGVTFAVPMAVGTMASVTIDVTAPIGVPAAVAGWVDFDHSGTFEDPAERILGGIYTGAGTTVPWTETFQVPAMALGGETYMRFRIFRTEPGVDVLPSPTGYGGEGEVEDYRVYILSTGPGPEDTLDYGDAPLPYAEASHELGGPYLGPLGDRPDAETGMQRDAQAAGDDNDADGDDENGLLSINLIKTAGAWSLWEIKGCFDASSDAKLGFWLDFNGDGDWDDSGELLIAFGFCGFGTGPQDWFHAMGAFQLPSGAKAGTTYARLRVYDDCDAALAPSRAGGPGEVEDYQVEIKSDGPGVPPGGIVHGYKWNDINGNGLWDILNPVEPPLAGWTIWLDVNNSGGLDAGDLVTQTDAQGHFRFAGVPAGTYLVGEQLHAGWTQTTPGSGTYTETVTPGSASFPLMFGNRQSGGGTNGGRICGSKWNDLNADGVPDADEPWVAGCKIYLDLNQNGRHDAGEPSQVTDAAGSFAFTGLAIGSYSVAEEVPPGWQQTWPGGTGTHVIQIQAGVQPACIMFGNTQNAGPGVGKELDFGDAPDPTFPTRRASNGAYHTLVPGFFLGGSVDADGDGQPAPDARGDDYDGGYDEDGVFFLTPLLPGGTAQIEVVASAAGKLDAWIDFDADGSWTQATDHVLTSVALQAGSNTLSVSVPAGAAIDTDAFARFRFSTQGVSSYEGQADDGEVEDYHILLGPEGPAIPDEFAPPHVKWSQPPLEIDPNADSNVPAVFCGWDEAARSTHRTGSQRQWRMDADDFRCVGPLPITRLRWWGGYKGWTDTEPPENQPAAWHIGFWANQVEGLEPDALYLERLVWSVEIPSERVGREPVGHSEFPEKFPEACFVYEVRLEPEEWFHQAEFASNDRVFWLSITAIYSVDAEPVNQWGWLTRPHVWRDGAVMPAIFGEWPTYDERLFPGRLYPVDNPAPWGQGQGCDLCFELLTEQPWVKRAQPFGSLRDWPHHQDEQSGGISIRGDENITRLVADDWVCERNTPVVAAAWWGSYVGYGYEACRAETEMRPPRPDYFLLRLWTDAEAMPGDVVWEYRAYDYDEVLVGFDRNPEGEPNEPVFRYSVALPEENWFRQDAPGGRYWFSVAAVYTDPLPRIVHPWGWTNHRHDFEAGALAIDDVPSAPAAWQPLRDPQDRPVDVSFTLFTTPE